MTTTATEAPVSIFADGDDWTEYHATLAFTSRLIGGIPADRNVLQSWIAARTGLKADETIQRQMIADHLAAIHAIDPIGMTVEEQNAAIDAAIEAAAGEKHGQVFHRTEDGKPCIEGRIVKAALKEWVSVSYPRGEYKWGQYRNAKGSVVGGKEPKKVAAEKLFVPERPIVVADAITDTDVVVGHPPDIYGDPQATLTAFEYIDGARCQIEVHVQDDFVTPEQWKKIWRTGERVGLGARRSQNAGQFVITAWERVG